MNVKKMSRLLMLVFVAVLCSYLNFSDVKAEEVNKAQVGEGEFIPDPEMERLIEKKEMEMEQYLAEKSKNARASTQNCIHGILQSPQETGSWCAYSSMRSILLYEGFPLTQSRIVNEISGVTGYTYDFSGQGCPWLMVHGDDISQFPAAVYLNSKLGMFEYAPYPYGPAGATQLDPVQIRARVVYSIDMGKGVLVNGVSQGGQSGYIPYYPTGYIGHWIVVRGYRESGNVVDVVDPVASSAVGWGANVPPYYTLELDKITGFAQAKGIMY